MPFNLNLRKILIIIGFIIIAIGIGFAVFFVFFATPKEDITQPTTETPTGGGSLPIANVGSGQVPQIGEESPGEVTGVLPEARIKETSDLTLSPASSITLSGNGQSLQYYDQLEGVFYKINENGTQTALTDKKFFQVEDITWSNDKNQAVLEYPDGSNIVYNFQTGEQSTLPKHWEDFSFSQDGEKIVAKSMGQDTSNRWLILSDSNGTNAKVISALGENADKVQVALSPNEQVVGFSKTGDPTNSFETQEVYLIGQNNENFKSLFVNGFDFKAKWTTEGDRIIYSVTDPDNGYRPTLWSVDATGDDIGKNATKINLDTWVDKCTVISGYKAYCAVPKNLETGAGLEPDIAFDSDDVFYFINLKTGVTSFVGEPETDYNVNQISVSDDEKFIYFTDTQTDSLHKLPIE